MNYLREIDLIIINIKVSQLSNFFLYNTEKSTKMDLIFVHIFEILRNLRLESTLIFNQLILFSGFSLCRRGFGSVLP
jgi:hypothetical protein